MDEKTCSVLMKGLDVEHSGPALKNKRKKKIADSGQKEETYFLFCKKIEEKTGRIVISFLYNC